MRRREFIALLGAASCVRHVQAQQSQRTRVGYLAPGENRRLYEAFVKGLSDLGYVEGRDLTIAYRSAEGRAAALDLLAVELVRFPADVIVTLGANAAQAAKRATATIPIVFAPVGDAVPAGLVQSLARPGGNATGVSINSWILNAKRLELLKETFPAIRRVAVLGNAANPNNLPQWEQTRPAGEALRLDLRLVMIDGPSNLSTGFSKIAQENVDALHFLSDAAFDVARHEIVAGVATLRLPATYEHRAFVEAGGLMSYGPNLDRISYRAAYFVERIIKGARPQDLPVEQPTTFELIINLKTAKALGLKISPTLLARADEVIE